MFCFQCEQTAKGEGCTRTGVCGKPPEVAALQDLIIHALKGLAHYAVEGRRIGIEDREVDTFACQALFTTLTNVNFDTDRFVFMINHSIELRDALKERIKKAGVRTDFDHPEASFAPAKDLDGLIQEGEAAGIKSDPGISPDTLSLSEILIYGLKGMAAYADLDHGRGLECHPGIEKKLVRTAPLCGAVLL